VNSIRAPKFDYIIIGAGPAGMAAAITARAHGLSVLVLDEQPSAGGQIFRNIESHSQYRIIGIIITVLAQVIVRFTLNRTSGAASSSTTTTTTP